jgi:hypothetical protein
MAKGNRTPRTEKQLVASKLPKGGGRPKGTGAGAATKTMAFAIPLELATLLEGVQGSKSGAVAEALRMYFRLETKAAKKRFQLLEKQNDTID